MAIAPQVKAKMMKRQLGCNHCNFRYDIYAYLYVVISSAWPISVWLWCILRGALHEIAHVIAAAAGGSTAVDIAVIVKLTRVAMLVPVAILIGLWFGKSEGSEEKDHGATFQFRGSFSDFSDECSAFARDYSEVVAGYIVVIAYMLIAMAMAGLGLNVEFKTFRKLGSKAFVAGLIGSVCLSVLGYVLVYVLGLCSSKRRRHLLDVSFFCIVVNPA